MQATLQVKEFGNGQPHYRWLPIQGSALHRRSALDHGLGKDKGEVVPPVAELHVRVQWSNEELVQSNNDAPSFTADVALSGIGVSVVDASFLRLPREVSLMSSEEAMPWMSGTRCRMCIQFTGCLAELSSCCMRTALLHAPMRTMCHPPQMQQLSEICTPDCFFCLEYLHVHSTFLSQHSEMRPGEVQVPTDLFYALRHNKHNETWPRHSRFLWQVLHALLEEIKLDFRYSAAAQSSSFSIRSIQIDDQILTSSHPVVLAPSLGMRAPMPVVRSTMSLSTLWAGCFEAHGNAASLDLLNESAGYTWSAGMLCSFVRCCHCTR